MKLTPVTYAETTRLKGMAIVMILLHNFYHVLPGASLENEFTFAMEDTRHYFQTLIHSFRTADIITLVTDTFSFFGHYGVALFIFLSGYGLSRKYASSVFSTSGKLHFILKRILRFWKIIIPLIAVSVVVKTLKYGNGLWQTFIDHIGEYLSVLTFTHTLIPGKEFIVSGPWWFFAAILQLYILYIFLLRQKSNRFLLLISLAALIIQVTTIYFADESLLFRLRYNFVGWLPAFCLGIYYARKPDISFNFMIPLILMAVFLVSNNNPYLWLISSIIFPLAFIPLFRNIPVKTFWKFIGEISFYLFAIHSFVRGATFSFISPQEIVKQGVTLQTGLLYLAASILAAYLFRLTLNYSSRLFSSLRYRIKEYK